jgi:uncharacterized protein YeaO (DUF488 family)
LLKTKRVYEDPRPDDGERVLVDRLWPRGVSKEKAKLDDWAKELAPSDELRKWFDHAPGKWGKFRQRYRAELSSNEKREKMKRLAEESKRNTVTLLFAAKDEDMNNAVALKRFIENMQ